MLVNSLVLLPKQGRWTYLGDICERIVYLKDPGSQVRYDLHGQYHSSEKLHQSNSVSSDFFKEILEIIDGASALDVRACFLESSRTPTKRDSEVAAP